MIKPNWSNETVSTCNILNNMSITTPIWHILINTLHMVFTFHIWTKFTLESH